MSLALGAIGIEEFSRKGLNQSLAGGPDCGLGPVVHTYLVKDVNYVTLYGVMTDREDLGDFRIGKTFRQKAKHLELSAGEANLDSVIFTNNTTLTVCFAYGGYGFFQFLDAFFLSLEIQLPLAGIQVDFNCGD